MGTARLFANCYLTGYIFYIGIILFINLKKKEKVSNLLKSFFWIVLYALILVFFFVIAHKEYFLEENLRYFIVSSTVSFSISLVAPFAGIFAQFIKVKVNTLDSVRKTVIAISTDAAKIAFCTISVLLLFEFPYNNNIFSVQQNSLFSALIVVFFVISFIYYFLQRRNYSLAITLLAASILGIAVRQVFYLRGTVLNLYDLMVLNTAAEVGGAASFSFSPAEMMQFAILSICLFMLILCPYVPLAGWFDSLWKFLSDRFNLDQRLQNAKKSMQIIVKSLPTIFAIIANIILGLGFMSGISEALAYEYKIAGQFYYVARINNAYEVGGALPELLYQISVLKIQEPEGYNSQETENEIKKDAAEFDQGEKGQKYEQVAKQFEDVKPTVVAIMNETYSDPGLFQIMRDAGWDDSKRLINMFPDALSSGYVGVNTIGGGTANSEFEFFTGVSTGNYNNLYPYILFDLSNVNSVARLFKEDGYKTTAMHAFVGENYNRNKVYPQLGFDTFYDRNVFPSDVEMFHNFISDRATYKKIMEMIESTDDPQFIWNLTIQNHSGYNTGTISPELMTQYHFDGLTEEQNFALNEYLTCIEESNKAIQELIAELRTINKPVCVIFFGDHQSSLSHALSTISPSDDSEVVKFGKNYITPYFIWANYDVVGSDQINEHSNYALSFMGAKFSSMIGAPLSTYQKAELTLQDRLPFMANGVVSDTQGNWHSIDEIENLGDTKDAYTSLQNMQYHEFVEKVDW